MTLTLISNIANYFKYHYFWGPGGIDNVTLRLWKTHCRRRGWWYHVPHSSCLSRCLSGRFNYEGLMPHKQYFAGTLLGMSSCASYVSRSHDVIDDVTRSQSRSNFEIDISPSIFELERRSKAQNVGNAHGYLSGIFNFRYNFRLKSLSRALNSGHFENFEILNTASIWPQIWKDRPKLCQKKVFSWWWRHRWRHRVASKSALYIPL